MKSILVAAALLISGPAFGADLSPRPPAPQNAAATTWQGFYLGAHGGYGWSNVDFGSVEDIGKFKADSFAIGGHAGYLWQHGRIVVGLEAEMTYLGKKDSKTFEEFITARAGIDYMGAVKARLGFLVTESMLFYVSGGPAWAHTTATVSMGDESTTGVGNGFGWTVQGGTEIQIGQNWRAGVEVAHFDFSRTGLSFDTVPMSTNAKLTSDQVRLRVGAKF